MQTREHADYTNRVQFLTPEFCVDELNFSTLPNGSLVILDDFSFKKANDKQAKADFLKIVNYYLRHHEITLILIVHNLYNNSLLNEILLAPHLFLSYSNLGYYLMKYVLKYTKILN